MLVALSLLLSVGGMAARLMRIENDAVKNFCDGFAAQGIAEAGVRRALVVLNNNGNPEGLSETLDREGFRGTYRITTSTEGTALRLRSSGTAGTARRSASVLVSVVRGTVDGEPDTELKILSWGN